MQTVFKTWQVCNLDMNGVWSTSEQSIQKLERGLEKKSPMNPEGRHIQLHTQVHILPHLRLKENL